MLEGRGKSRRFLSELHRRRVLRVGGAYLVGAWLLIEVASVIFPALTIPDAALTYLIIAAAVGFPIALILAWVFDLTPGGIRRDSGEPAPDSNPGRILDLVVIAVLLGIISVFVYREWTGPAAPGGKADEHSVLSVAVLPFEDYADGDTAGHLGEGLAEEILMTLAGVPGIWTPARTSTFSLQHQGLDLTEIGNRLGVRHVLEGSVRTDPEQVHVSARLIELSDGETIWAERFERPLSELFSIQSSIARGVVGALTRRPAEAPAENLVAEQPTANFEAYQLYLRGRAEWYQRTLNSMMAAIGYYQRAVEIDPSYAEAYSALAEAWILLGMWGYVDPNQVVPRSRAAAESALSLDDDLPGTYVALAAIAHFHDYDWARAERLYERALSINEHYPTAHNWYSIHLTELGRHEESLAHIEAALRRDPLNKVIRGQQAYVYLMNRQFDEAMDAAAATLELDDAYLPAQYFHAWALQLKGEHQRALQEFRSWWKPLPIYDAVLAEALAAAGEHGETRIVLERLMAARTSGEAYVPPALIAAVHAHLGGHDEAFAWLEIAYAERDVRMARLRVDPVLDPLRGDPRMQEWLVRLDLAPAAVAVR